MTRLLALALVGSALVLACGREKPAPVVEPSASPPVVVKDVPTLAIERDAFVMRESGGLVMARVGGASHAFVADEDDGAIVEIDPLAKSIIASTKIGTRPRDLLVLADGRLAATLPDANAVAVYAREETGALREVLRTRTPADPVALALDPADATLYVSTGASHSLVALAGAALQEKSRVVLGREPRAVLVTSDGARVFVTHAIEDFVSIVSAVGEVTTQRTGNHTVCSGGGECSGARIARNAQAIVRSGEHGVVIPTAQVSPIPGPGFSKAALCRPRPRNADGSPLKQAAPKQGYGLGDGENGPPVTADLPTFDGATGKKWGTGLPPMLGAGCLSPRAGVAGADGSVLVACLGSARVTRFAPAPVEEWRGTFSFSSKGKPPLDIYSNGVSPNLTATVIKVPAGPTAIATFASGDALVWSAFARTLTRIAGKTTETVLEVPRHEAREASWLRGRELFFTNGDARISGDGRACASCHIDGADDGLTWKTPDGPRRTRFLRGEAKSGPYGWKGEHATLAEHIHSTMKNLGGTGLPDDAIADLSSYVTTLAKLPARKDESAEIARGKELFASAECSHCHTDGGSDRKVHDVGTGGAFVTPTLASAGTRRELFHDGRFKNLDDLIAGAPAMGRGASLTQDERRALTLYLATL